MESPVEIVNHFIGKWRLMHHDENFKHYLTLQGVPGFLQKFALISSFTKHIYIEELNNLEAKFIFCDITTINGLLTVPDKFTFVNSLTSEDINQNIRGHRFTGNCRFLFEENKVKYIIDKTRSDGLHLLFTVETTLKSDLAQEKRKMIASLTATKGDRKVFTVDTWEFISS